MQGCAGAAHTPQARHTAAVVNELSAEMQRILAAHPINAQRAAEGLAVANVVLLRGCGSRIKVPPFHEKHGMRAVIVAPTKIIAGGEDAGPAWCQASPATLQLLPDTQIEVFRKLQIQMQALASVHLWVLAHGVLAHGACRP